MNRLAIIVLNWNGSQDTIRCVDSLLLQTTPSSVVLVDNGSKAESFEDLDAYAGSKDRVTVLRNKKNLGFAGGVNTGISYAIEHNYEYVALFNNDAVAKKTWAAELLSELEARPEVSVITGLLLNESGMKIDSTGEQYSTWGMPFPRNRGDKATEAPESGYVFGATGGATLYRTSLFKEIGLFDERFFAYYEDVDVSFRAQLAGHKVCYTNKAIAYHKQGATSKKIPGFTVYQTFKNLPLLFIKNVPAGLIIPVGLRLLVLYWLFFLNAIRKGSGWYALKGWLASVWYFWTKSLWDRFSIQHKKVVSTDYIKGLLWHDLPPDQTGIRSLRAKLTGKK